MLKGFINSYRLYRATVEDWAPPAGTRVTRTSGSESSPAKSTKKLFKKLIRSGNIFKDTLQNGIALNQIFGALNSNSKVIKEFHPNKETFKPTDYTKEASRIFGTIVDTDSPGYTQNNNTFYSKVIASIQKRYPQLQECCIIGWAALCCTSVGTAVALLVCCINFCCVCSKGACTPCCRVRGVKETCASFCGCVELTREPSGADPQPFARAQGNPNIRHPGAPAFSAQRDSTQASRPLVPPPRGVKDYSSQNWQPGSVLPGQSESNF